MLNICDCDNDASGDDTCDDDLCKIIVVAMPTMRMKTLLAMKMAMVVVTRTMMAMRVVIKRW